MSWSVFAPCVLLFIGFIRRLIPRLQFADYIRGLVWCDIQRVLFMFAVLLGVVGGWFRRVVSVGELGE